MASTRLMGVNANGRHLSTFYSLSPPPWFSYQDFLDSNPDLDLQNNTDLGVIVEIQVSVYLKSLPR